MAFAVPIEISREFEVTCDFDRVFDLLADVPQSASHFPKVEELEHLGDETFRWHMQKIGLGMYSVRTIYSCRYTNSRDEGWVEWKPVAGDGNASVEGFWNFEVENDSIYVEFYIKAELAMDLPFLAKVVVSPLAVAEFNSLVNVYIENLKRTFAS